MPADTGSLGPCHVTQVEADKFKLFYVLLQVPPTVVKHLNRVAQTGYDKLRLQLAGVDGGDGDENEEQDAEDAHEDAMAHIDWSQVDFSKTAERPMKRSRMWSLAVCLKLSLPLLATCAFFGSTYLAGVNFNSNIGLNAKVAYKLDVRKVRGVVGDILMSAFLTPEG